MHDNIRAALARNDKGKAMQLCLKALDDGLLSVSELYEQVLAAALNEMQAEDTDMADLIWQEHNRSAIVRSIIEACYPQVLRAREREGTPISRRVVVLCPAQETHEIGARMVADFFLIAGYQVTYLGADTPPETMQRAIRKIEPTDLCLSVSNAFNLFAAKRLIETIRNQAVTKIRVIVGGQAFEKNPDAWRTMGVDRVLRTFAEIRALRREDEA